MGVLSFVRRRLNGKFGQIFKRVILPIVMVALMFKVMTSSDITQQDQTPKNLVMPGEALDPFAPKISDHRPHKEINIEVPKVITKNEKKPEVPQKQFSSPKKKSPKDDDSEGYLAEDLERMPSSWSLYKSNVKDHEKVKARGHAITNDTVTLTLMSSSDKVFMSLNKKEIYRGLEERGIHVVVINEHNGRVMAKRVFDTCAIGNEIEMVEFIDDVSDGRILVFAVRDDAASGLTWRGRNKLVELGSRWAEKLQFRDMWALVTRQGGIKLAETFSNVATADTGYEWGGPVFLRTDFDLEQKPKNCNWPHTKENIERAKFCARYEGYGKLCACKIKNWEDVFYRTDEKIHNSLMKESLYNDMDIVILCSNRPNYLFKTIKSMWEAPGLNKDKVSVYCEKPTREVINLINLFKFKLISTPVYNSSYVSTNLRHKLQRIFWDKFGTKFPSSSIPEGNLPPSDVSKADYVLIIDDDISLSIDIFKFFYSISSVFDADKSVLAATAFNYYGHKDVATSLTMLYRTTTVSTIALLLPKTTVNNILAPIWPATNTVHGFRYFFKDELDKSTDYAIVFPEVPRAKHASYTGSTIASGIQYNLFRDHAISLSLDYSITKEDVQRVTLPRYDNEVTQMIKSIEPTVVNLCAQDFLYGEEPKSIFISGDTTSIKYIMECLKTFPAFPVNDWRGVWRFRYHGHPLYVVSSNSTLSNLKPDKYEFMTAPPPNSTTTTPSTANAA